MCHGGGEQTSSLPSNGGGSKNTHTDQSSLDFFVTIAKFDNQNPLRNPKTHTHTHAHARLSIKIDVMQPEESQVPQQHPIRSYFTGLGIHHHQRDGRLHGEEVQAQGDADLPRVEVRTAAPGLAGLRLDVVDLPAVHQCQITPPAPGNELEPHLGGLLDVEVLRDQAFVAVVPPPDSLVVQADCDVARRQQWQEVLAVKEEHGGLHIGTYQGNSGEKSPEW